MTDLETLSGTVENVVFHNEDTGYTVCAVRPVQTVVGGNDLVTLVGKCAAIWEGEELTARGEWINSPHYGRQFKAQTITCIAPTSAEGIRRYLSSGMIKGVGKVTAQRIVDHFGANTLDVLDKASARLEEVDGIGRAKRLLIRESWVEQRSVRDIMIFLQSNGIGTGQAARIYRRYGADAIAVVKRNPYRLCEDVWGIGFKTADAIAARVGISPESELRAQAGLLYFLRTQAEDGGHCFAIESELLLQAQELLNIPLEILAEALKAETARGKLVKEEQRIYLCDLYHDEMRAAQKLLHLAATPPSFPPIAADKAVPWAERKMGLTLAAAQWEALCKTSASKVALITGGPGVGKTTIIRALCEIYAARKLRIFLAAPTGRAAKRMSESTGRPATTLHRLLKYQPQTRDFLYNAENPIPGDCFILDEASMLDITLTRQVLDALPAAATLIIVGDTDQLPSVGPGNVLHDLIASRAFPCTRLTAIYRQDVTGYIVRNAHRVNQGDRFILPPSGEKSDFYFIETAESADILTRTVELMTRRIPKQFQLDPLHAVQILTPMRRGTLGAENINDVIQRTLNPTGPALNRGGTLFRKNDRVMQLCNNYDKDVFNGDVGHIAAVDEATRELVVLYDGRPVTYQQSELDELTLSYACSIHKSQGSEYPAVILLLHTQHFKLLQRNLLYTAITRGRRLVCVVGSSKAISIALNNNLVRERRTTLCQRLDIKGRGSS